MDFEFVHYTHSLIWTDSPRNEVKEAKRNEMMHSKEVSEPDRFDQVWLNIYVDTK